MDIKHHLCTSIAIFDVETKKDTIKTGGGEIMKILIAEDNAILQKSVGLLMKWWGFDFDLVSNGREAVEQAVSNYGNYDLGLMDIDMPEMDGCEATRRIRKKVSYFPIMAFSGHAGIEEECAAAGMDDFLAKPCEPERLLKKIRELTLKSIKISFRKNELYFIKEMPMDAAELKELRELDKQGLAKFSLIDTGHKFIVHKNLQNKLSHDFVAKGKLLSEFLDRSVEDPGIIHLYALNLHANKRHILPETFEELEKQENEELEEYTARADYPEKREREV